MTLAEVLPQVLGTAAAPLKTGDIVKQAKLVIGKPATPKAVAEALDALVGGGTVACFSGGTAGKPQLYYTTLSLERATAALLRPHIHSAKKPPEAARLRAKLPVSLHPHFEPAVALLAAAGEAFIGTGAKRLVHARAPLPSSLLSAPQRKALQKILDGVNAVRPASLTLADFIAWIDTTAPAASAPHPAVATETEPAPESALPAPVLTEPLLRSWYDEDHRRSSTVMIPIPQTFARYAAWAQAQGLSADSQVLRNFMVGLYNNGLILLEPCERPQDLPAHERAMLVPMSLGPPGWSWCWSV